MRANSATTGNNLLLGFFSLLLVIVLMLMGCGGGSAGTGTGPIVVVQGAILDQSGSPVSDVSIRVIETGGEATTTSNGEFQLTTESESDSVTLEVISEDGNTAYIKVEIPEDGGTVEVVLTINPKLDQINAETLEVGAAIVGRCNIYFENRLTIRQSNRTPKGLKCVAKVTVAADGRRLGDVPFLVQYRDCRGELPWVTVAAGTTMGRPNQGIGQAEFPFTDDESHCLYRIVAPVGVRGLPELERIIQTATFQRSQ
jgi:hypothetical protein